MTLVDDVLRSRGAFAPTATAMPVRSLVVVVAVGGFVQGAVMGSHDGRLLQSLYSGLKVPVLLLVSATLCVPSSYVLHLALGLGRDFAAACRASFLVQAVAALFLASCAPLIAFAYLSSDHYPFATFVNGLAYLGAALAAHLTLRVHYRPLLARDRSHRITLAAWLALYILVAIQMAWTMRPFVGWPDLEPALFRSEAWGNAYVHLVDALVKLLR